MTEDFYRLITEATPEAERHGPVFNLTGQFTRCPITPRRVCREVSKIGRLAGVVVATADRRRKRRAGRRRTKEGGKPAWQIRWDGDDGKPETKIIFGTKEEAEKECCGKRDGKLVTVSVKKFASCHDLRRSFGTRWAKRVMPAVLQRLMRHSQIATTMKHYVTMDADSVADELWGRDWKPGNTFGNTRPKAAQESESAPVENSTEAIETKQVI